ncbi:MAG: biopolymer transporter ExbD [Cytophagales bacterium]|nr:MAG: biopolymer transporter ExbD [Cytophagales bacterium]
MAEIADDGGGKKGKKKGGKKNSTKVDMTPMVDLGFLLITFFMLTTTMSKPKTMELNMPDKTIEDQKIDVKASQTMTLFLGKDDQVYWFSGITPAECKEKDLLQKTDYSSEGIRKIILEETKKIGYDQEKKLYKIIIVIKACETAKYKNMVDILDEMHITGSKRYAIVGLEEIEKELIKKYEDG